MTVNDRIKHIRKKANLSQEEFASKINLAGNSISRIENGTRNPSERTIIDICERFDVNYDWLKNGVGEIYKETSDTIITLLKSKYNLDDLDIKIIEQYMTLSPIERQVFKDYIKKMGAHN